VGTLRIDPAARRVTRSGDELTLTKTEYELLLLLAEHAGQVLTRDTILERVWGYDFETTSNSLDVYIGYLRRKTELGGHPRLIQTIRGVGYALRES
jgi:DNA-binding response OmpR family regulator